jgi:hypothetical protein
MSNNENTYEFYCLSFNNKERKESMKSRFDKIGINCKFYEGVSFNDTRISKRQINENVKRVWSCNYGHLDMIYYFYNNTDKEYGIFCEDDLLIHKNLLEFMPKIINDFKVLDLDVLLLGYLVQHKINEFIPDFHLKNSGIINSIDNKYKYHNYHEQIWGTQMYMLSRKQAGILLDKYYTEYADKSVKETNMTPFSSDWTLTKEGNRGLIYPMLACENGLLSYDNHSQNTFHQNCFTISCDMENFI